MSRTINQLSNAGGRRESQQTPKTSGQETDPGSSVRIVGQPKPPKINQIPIMLLVGIGALSVLSFAISVRSLMAVENIAKMTESRFNSREWEQSDNRAQLTALQKNIKQMLTESQELVASMEKKITDLSKDVTKNNSEISQLAISNNALRAYVNDLNRITSQEINKLKNQK